MSKNNSSGKHKLQKNSKMIIMAEVIGEPIIVHSIEEKDRIVACAKKMNCKNVKVYTFDEYYF